MIILSLGIGLVCSNLASSDSAYFQRCGFLAGGGSSHLRRVADGGNHAVGWSTASDGEPRPIRFRPSIGLENLGFVEPEVEFGESYGVSHDGTVVVGISGWISSFVWKENLGISKFEDVDSTRGLDGIASDGSTVVGHSTIYGDFRYAFGGTLHVTSIHTLGLNGDGSYISGQRLTGGTQSDAVLWCEDLPLVVVDERTGSFDKFSDVSADGSTCTLPNAKRPRIWKEDAGIVELPTIYDKGNALAISADGQVVVGSCEEHGTPQGHSAFIWTAETGTRRIKDVLTSLGVNVGSFHLITATDISADGTTICGNGGPSATSWPNEGWMCRIPRTALSPYSARPNYVKPIFGSITAGDRRGTFKPEDSRLEFTSGITPTFNSAPITVEFSATQARTYGKLDFDIDLQVNKSGLQQSLDLWDWDLNNWVQVDSRAATKDADQLVSLSFPLGHWYVRYDGRVKARLRIKPSLPQAQPGFKAKVDYVAWKVTPPQ